MPAILMLILMLSYLHTDYSDTDADLCIKIMFLYCVHYLWLYANDYSAGTRNMNLLPIIVQKHILNYQTKAVVVGAI